MKCAINLNEYFGTTKDIILLLHILVYKLLVSIVSEDKKNFLIFY